MSTIARLLAGAADALTVAGIDDARLEAEVLLADALGTDRTHLLASLQEQPSGGALGAFEASLARRLAREPLAYIIGRREFYGLSITCSPGALIPRPETELLVELALDELWRQRGRTRVADIGTGTGAIAVAVAAHAADAAVMAVDVSPDALVLARRNVDEHGCRGRIQIVEGDLFLGRGGPFDIILANLPYVSEREWAALAPEVRDHEPKDALVPGPLGTEAVARLLTEAPVHLASGGLLAAEIGATQGAALLDVASACFPGAAVCVKKDLAGLDRVLVVRTRE